MEMLRRFDGYVKKMPTASALTIVTLCTPRRFVGRAVERLAHRDR
jgi:hypothetical protein